MLGRGLHALFSMTAVEAAITQTGLSLLLKASHWQRDSCT